MFANLAPGPIPTSDAGTRDPARGELKAEVCIIGGGITGIATAYALSKKGIQCLVIEAGRVGGGGTGVSGGQLLVGTAPDSRELERIHGFSTAQFLWDLSVEALAQTKDLAQTAGAPCNFRAGHLSVAETPTQSRTLYTRTEYRETRLNYSFARMVSGVELKNHIDSPRYCCGAFDYNEGHLDPEAFISNLARSAEQHGALILEGSPVVSVDRKLGRLQLKGGSIKAEHIIFCAGPWNGNIDLRLSRYISSVYVYVCCFEPRTSLSCVDLLPSGAAVSDLRHICNFFKPTFTGGIYLGGPCAVSPLAERSANKLVKLMAEIFPQASGWNCIDVRRGVLCISRAQLPVCGRKGDRIFWAGGYSGHGLTWAVRIGDLIADSLTGDSSQFDQLAALGLSALEPLAPIKPVFTPLGVAYLRFLDRVHNSRTCW